MSEYLKVLSDNKCTTCQKYHCFNTELFVTDVRENPEKRKVGRVRYDERYLIHEQELTIAECPTKKIIDEKQRRVGKGLCWKLVENSTIEKALSSLDIPLVSNSDSMLIVETKIPQDR